MSKDFKSSDWKKFIPEPVCDDFPEYSEFYNNAWELARNHLKEIDGLPQSPYMDEAFDETRIWIWDSCFMALFCKFAQDRFPGIETLKNFYEVLYDGKNLPKIVPNSTAATIEDAVEIKIHHADNPPLFAWAEYENALFHGDKEYLKRLLYEKRYLQKHYEWIESLCEETSLPNVAKPTKLQKFSDGYKWAGYPSGMDNTPRGKTTEHATKDRPDNPDMLWLDAICQQALSALCISKMFGMIGDGLQENEWQNRYNRKKNVVNRLYWDDKDKFYYDIDCNSRQFLKVPTIASFWTITAAIASKAQAANLLKKACDAGQFGGDVPLITLSRKDADFEPKGRYWRGGLWLPTAYAALTGFSEYGYHKEAHDAAYKIFKHMLKTYKEYEPHTIWECYAPDFCTPATRPDNESLVRPDFCGWSALGPISIYIEYVLGFHNVNAFTNTVEWEKPIEFKSKTGVRNLRFGDIITDIVAENGFCTVISNSAYTLKINEKPYKISAGKNSFKI